MAAHGTAMLRGWSYPTAVHTPREHASLGSTEAQGFLCALWYGMVHGMVYGMV